MSLVSINLGKRGPRGTRCASSECNPIVIMLETVAIAVVVMWFLGMLSSYTLGGYIHILLFVALVAVLLRFVRGRNPLN